MKRFLLWAVVCVGAVTAQAGTFTVTNNLDSGLGSLRQAFTDVNASADPANTIQFNMAGGPPVTIALSSGSLPVLTKQVTIDGTTQTGWSTNAPSVVLSGYGLTGGVGVALSGPTSTVRGLRIQGFTNSVSGAGIQLSSVGHVVVGNHIVSNYNGIAIASSSNTIGGALYSTNRNVISGNFFSGIFMNNGSAGHNTIAGNLIGLDPTGSAAWTNKFSGISNFGSPANVIGGSAGQRNIISGNANFGLSLDNAGSVSNTVSGNYIGLDITGSSPLPNLQGGVSISVGRDNTIGGSGGAQTRNVISGNKASGVQLNGAACANNLIQGNYMGTDASGALAVSNGSAGVAILSAPSNRVVGNVVSGNGGLGISLSGTNGVGNIVQGNRVGLEAAADAPLRNNFAGVQLLGVSQTLVGGTNESDGNIIAFNALGGVTVATNASVNNAGFGNTIIGNTIYSNIGLAIDLAGDGVTTNDPAPDADPGANNNQNFPVVTNAQQGSSLVQGRLISAPSQSYRVECFATRVPQGSIFLGATNVATPADGTATFSVVFTRTAPTGAIIVATATDTNGNTSEYGTGATNKPAVDADGDGLWDAWETANLGSTAFNGGGDNDGDGENNYAEFIADTGPTNGASFFHLTVITNGLPHYPGWTSSAARWYDVEYSTNPLSPTWVNVGTNLVGTGGTQTFADAVEETNRVYRVRVKVP